MSRPPDGAGVEGAEQEWSDKSMAEFLLLADVLLTGMSFEHDASIGKAARAHLNWPVELPLFLQISSLSGMQVAPSGKITLTGQHDSDLSRDLNTLLRMYPSLSAKIHETRNTLRRTVSKMLRPFVDNYSVPSRAEFEAVSRWSPIIGPLSYGVFARTLGGLDRAREVALGEAHSEFAGPEIRGYYKIVHMLASFSLLSADRAAGGWLPDMARSFSWKRWTPSFSLTRERTVWLAAAAAKSASSFGTDVVEAYRMILSKADHALVVFDALFGLAAIAISHPDARDEIAGIVASEAELLHHRPVAGAEFAEAAFRSAVEVLTAGEPIADPAVLARLGWSATVSTGDGLATHAAFRMDPTETDAAGLMVGFRALPAMVTADASRHFPRSRARVSTLLPRPQEMSALMVRAWSAPREKNSKFLN